MKSEYPTKKELRQIKEWPVEDFEELISFIRNLWCYKSEIKTEWINNKKFGYNLKLTLCTVGWSGNEDIIEALLKNKMFNLLWYTEWHRGGKYVFEINPINVGYKLVSNYCKENKISRQAVYQSKNKYNFIKVSPKIVFIKSKINNK